MWTSENKSGDIDIEPGEWIAFLDGFSRQHEGWLATIEVATAGGKLKEVVNQRLRGVSIDHADGHQRAYVEMGDPSGQALTHTVERPTRIRFRRTQSGAHEGLEIESADGTRTIVRFRSAMLPETLDGIAS
ncbi:MAG TPA: DUF5335 family protein [Terriglobales bacterium]|jgi:hypothetical protein|nr:DUF5335 family protein [Terriglobales bacterium]